MCIRGSRQSCRKQRRQPRQLLLSVDWFYAKHSLVTSVTSLVMPNNIGTRALSCCHQERQRQQAEQQEAEKAAKAAAAEQAVKERAQTRAREQQEAQQRLVAHKQGLKAAKTRINRAALQGLGEAFAARLQVLLPIFPSKA